MDVTVLYFDGCPSWRTALERVEVASARAGVPVRVSTVDVTSDADADRLGFTGSPTILLDGADPFAQPGASPALACRLYATPGGMTGSPTVDQLAAALTKQADRPAHWPLATRAAEGEDGFMAAIAQEHGQMQSLSCWCCGNPFDEKDLTRLGSHPEVAVCAGCASWLSRRARSAAEAGLRTPGAQLRRTVASTRDAVTRAGLQDWPVLGPPLRRLDRHLP